MTADSSLSGLTIGTLSLTPTFDSKVLTYTVTTTNATNKVTATPASDEAEVALTVNGSTLENASNASWTVGENTLIAKVTNGEASTTYTVTVTKS